MRVLEAPSFFIQPVIEAVLRPDAWCAGCSFFEYVLQAVVHPAGFLVVGELDVEHFNQAVAQVGGEDGRDGFDAAVEVATHPVGRTHENFGAAVVAEVPDAGVLKETVYNTGDTDVTTV